MRFRRFVEGRKVSEERTNRLTQNKNEVNKMFETIKLSDFLDGSYKTHRKPYRAFSFIPLPTVSSLFGTPSLVILGLGAAIIGLTFYEKRLIAQGKDIEAEMVSMFTGIGLTTAGIGGAVFVLVKAGGVFL